MDIWSIDKLYLFVAFVVPGFISVKTYQLVFQSATKETANQLIDAIAYSCMNYALLFWPILSIESSGIKNAFPNLYYAFYFFVLFLMPVAIVFIFWKLRGSQFFQRTLPHPIVKPWDYVFSQRKPYWVIVTLKSGQKVAGRYDSNSFTSSAPSSEQIYLEETWTLNGDGGFERSRDQTAGIIILATDIETVELFNVTYGGTNGRRENELQRGLQPIPEGLSADDPNTKARDRGPGTSGISTPNATESAGPAS